MLNLILDLGTTCEVAKDCATENAACKNGVCVCEDNYYQSESQCLPGKAEMTILISGFF